MESDARAQVIGLDTNVLLRLVVADDPEQSARARACFLQAASERPVVINPIALAEFAWTMARTFKANRREIAGHIEAFLDSDDVEVAFADSARRALEAYRSGRADFPDYFIASLNADLGCDTTVTFDKKALDFGEFSAVP